jgi:hypothetical protein
MAGSWRILRAFAWMRWRVLMNSLDRTGGRDALERLSLAVEQIGPFIAFGLLVPSAVILAILAGFAGYWLPTNDRVLTFDALRMLLLAACGFSIAGPLLMPSMERTSGVRLLLLPIPRRTLYAAQATTALTDPWILLAIPILLALPLGLAAAGAVASAALAMAAGVALLLLLVGLSALATFVLHLIVRDRRRGELFALLIVILPVLLFLPSMMSANRTRAERVAERAAAAERRARGEVTMREYAWQVGERAYRLLPSELFATAAHRSARGERRGPVAAIAGLAFLGVVLHGLGLMTFRRLLDSPAGGGRRQAASASDGRSLRLPGLSRAAAAVAHAHLRLALRTPRGRSIVLSPVLVCAVFAFLMSRSGGFPTNLPYVGRGIGLAAFAAGVCFLSTLPLAMNQFAVDRAGLTLALLAPIAPRELLIGKAVGNVLITGGPTLGCILIAYATFRDGSLSLWMTLLPALAATYALAAPGAAALSAMFPRQVDLNSIGRGSNAHGVAGFLGLLLFLAAGLPTIVVAIVPLALFERPWLTPILMSGWCVVALLISRALFTGVAAIFVKRQENLAMVAT